MSPTTKYIVIGAVILIIGVIALAFLQETPQGQKVITGGKNLDAFAKCLTQKGAIFYGAFWCPHCQRQKQRFGDSIKHIKYVECSTPDGKGQTQVCIEKKIESYPTWIFKDNSRKTGEVELVDLGKKTSCQLPKS